MAKHVGVKLPDDLIRVLKHGQTVAILSTFSEKGFLIQRLFNAFIQKGLKAF